MSDEPYGIFTEETSEDRRREKILSLRREYKARMTAIKKELNALYRSAKALAQAGKIPLEFIEILQRSKDIDEETRRISKSDIWTGESILMLNIEKEAMDCGAITSEIFKQPDEAKKENKRRLRQQLEEGRQSLFETMQAHHQKHQEAQPPGDESASHLASAATQTHHGQPPSDESASRLASAARIKNHTIKCIECGKTFRSHKRSAKTCSDKCRKRLSRRTK